MHKKHVRKYSGLRKKGAAVRQRLLLQVATLVKERAAQCCPAWPITAVLLVEAGAGFCRGVYFAEGDDGGDQTCAPSTLAKKLWASVHTRI